MQKTVGEPQSLAAQKSLTLSTNIQLENVIVINDEARLRQILVNLLSNAIKFTETGYVKVILTHSKIEAKTESSSTEATHLEQPLAEKASDIVLSVTDTGCGITAEDQQYIFDPFHQSDQKVTRKHAGTGLGLAITQSLVKMMGGNIEVERQINQGTTYTVTLPSKVNIEKTGPLAVHQVYSQHLSH